MATAMTERTTKQWLWRMMLWAALFILHPSLSMLHAQGNTQREIYDQAEEEYRIGHIDNALTLLQNNIGSFSSNLRPSAYRLIVLCHLGNDDMEQAEASTSDLLRLDPYYSPSVQDPARFVEMVRRIRQGRTSTITTASIQAESLSEVPVPTTLITEEMIHNSGARNLQEVLAAYVPGMNIIDCNDDINIAMRGIFSNGQEKILIMLNGHRLNSYCTNIASPDFSISLEKLKQIEVLRGPASSLYGGVALTAVVNLITKEGADVDGIKMHAGIGNYGQRRGDIMLGKHFYDLDILLWGSIYTADGENQPVVSENRKRGLFNDTVNVGAIGRKPSYEFGLSLKWKDLKFIYNTQFSQVISPLTISTTGESYSYDKYRTFNGLNPGFATRSHHGRLSYIFQLDKVYIEQALTFDNSDLTHYQVISDSKVPEFGEIISVDTTLVNLFKEHEATSRYINGQETTLGWQMKGDMSYIDNSSHKGYVTFGAEYAHFKLEDVRYSIGYDFNKSMPESPLLAEVGKGKESNYNAFLQLKHKWRSFIVNAGVRYDHKRRYNDSKINELSPRLALILVRPKWNVKFSYSKSFVDAPYLYQKINQFLQLFSTHDIDYVKNEYNSLLAPESLHSYQLTFAGTEWVKGLNWELNLFHNQANDLILTEVINHSNSGKNKTIGAEFMASYQTKRISANFNLSWIKTLKLNLSYKDIDDNNCTPAITSNTVLAWKATNRLKLFSKLTFESRQTSYNVSLSTMMKLYEIGKEMVYYVTIGDLAKGAELLEQEIWLTENELVSELDIDARAILDAGAEYKLLDNLTLGLNVSNLFNTKYYRSGMNTRLVPQRGRWFMLSIGLGL